MILVFATLAGFILGGGIVAYFLSRRWKNDVSLAEAAMQEVLEQYKQEQQELKDAKQTVADLTYQLNEAKKDIQYLKERE